MRGLTQMDRRQEVLVSLIRKHSTHVRKYQRRNLIKLRFNNYNIHIKQ